MVPSIVSRIYSAVYSGPDTAPARSTREVEQQKGNSGAIFIHLKGPIFPSLNTAAAAATLALPGVLTLMVVCFLQCGGWVDKIRIGEQGYLTLPIIYSNESVDGAWLITMMHGIMGRRFPDNFLFF